jgi:predicted nucleic acid-binding protein
VTNDVLLLDSGVWIASANINDPFVRPSKELVADTRRTFGALDLTLYEVANAIGSKRRSPQEAAGVCLEVEERCWRTMVRIDALLIEATVEIAGEHGLTSYDAAYVAVARRHEWTLVSTDIRDLVSRGFAITPDAAV